MRQQSRFIFGLCLILTLCTGSISFGQVEFKDGDTIVFLGDTLIERAGEFGHIEATISASYPDSDLKFRNLGWSADTILGLSRAGFDHLKPEPGWRHLVGALKESDPDWVVFGYGMAESFGGDNNLEAFETGFRRLIGEIHGISPEKDVQFIFLSPIAHEMIPGPLPSPAPHNRDLRKYVKLIQNLAHEFDSPFVNLYGWSARHPGPKQLTDNGIHLNDYGYQAASQFIGKRLKLKSATQQVRINRVGEAIEKNIAVGSAVHFRGGESLSEDINYLLRIDGRPVAVASGSEWKKGVPVSDGPIADAYSQLQQSILEKNKLFFYRWRPQNNTYLFLFRKHEQGQNAREIPMFDPLIAGKESEIFRASKPKSHLIEFEPTQNDSIALSQGDAEVVQLSGDSASVPGFKPPTQKLPEFIHDDDIEISLYASNPLLAKPIHMNFDAEGRLWIASSEVYPHIEPGQKQNDKIIVIEDTDKDGVADVSRVFADGLLIPTGVAAGDGGVYVGHSTELIHLKDTDGDGYADRKKVVLSGFGTEDTHHILHSLRWGPDGMLYMNQSIYIHTHIETPHGVVRLNSGGILHLRPSTQEVGVYIKGFCNPWGHHFDKWGQSFVTDGAGGQGLSLAVQGAMYFTYAGAPRLMPSVSPGRYPKFCGLELVNSPAFPDSWQGDAITCDFRAHKVVRFSIDEKSSAYVTTQQPNLVSTSDVTFRPIDVKFGPDGALYIADWSNPIIQHGEVDFRDPRRDHVNGRIWRVTHKKKPLQTFQDLNQFPSAKLMDNLESDSGFLREKSRRVLTERGSSILPDLQEWVRSVESERSLLEALWLYQSIDIVEPRLLQRLMKSEDHRIRSGAYRVIYHWIGKNGVNADWIAGLRDPHPRVRMESLRILSKVPGDNTMNHALSVLENPTDPYLEYALWLTVNDLADSWISALDKGNANLEEINESQIAYALKSIPDGMAGRVLEKVLASSDIPKNGSGPWLGIIGQAGTKGQIDKIYQLLLDGYFNEQGQSAGLDALNRAAQSNRVIPDNRGDITRFLQSDNAEVRASAIRLAGNWKDIRGAFAVLSAIPLDTSRPGQERLMAMQSLSRIGGSGAVNQLAKVAGSGIEVPLRYEAARLLSTHDTVAAWDPALKLMNEGLSDNQILNLWRSFLQVKGAADKLEPLVRISTLTPKSAELGVRVAQEGGRQLPGLVISITQAGNLEKARQLTSKDMKFLASQSLEVGDPYRGEVIYRRENLACVSCHAIGGIGGVLGPDLTSIGASAPADYLVESLFMPNAKIKEGYHAINVDTIAELTFSGTLIREDEKSLWLRDAGSKEVEIAKDEIVSRELADYSLMPVGLIDNLSSREKMDLVAFLSRLGKGGDFDGALPDRPRQWYIFPATIDAAQFGDDKIIKTPLENKPGWRGGWKPYATRVDGRLLRESLEYRLKDVESRAPNKLFLAARFELATDKKVTLQLEGVDLKTSQIWLDAKPVAVDAGDSGNRIEFSPGAGTHTLVISFPAGSGDKLPEFVRAVCGDVTFLTD